jgi:hypothetical protein
MASDPQPLSDLKIVKSEMFDADMMTLLYRHEGVPTDIKQTLKAYRKKATNGNQVQVVYEFGKQLRGVQKGRVYPTNGLGLQTMRGDIRAALASKYYWDVDVVNAQPHILVALCKKRGWACERLEEYVNNRASKLAEIQAELGCNRDDAKQYCLSILFGGSPYKTISPYFTELSSELSRIADNVAAVYSDIYRVALKEKKNPKASCLATVAQDQERLILLALDGFFKTHGRTFDVLIHDGGLIRKADGETEFPAPLLRAAEAHVLEALDYPIRLEVKPLVHSFQPPASEDTELINDAYAAKRFVELLADNLVLDKSGNRYCFDTTTGLWTSSDDNLRRWLNVFEKEMTFTRQTENGPRVYDYAGKESNIQNMLKNINRYLTPVDFIEERLNRSTGKLLFADGICDIEAGTFTEGFDPSIFFSARITRKFPQERDEPLIAHVNKLLFQDPYLEEQKEQAHFFKIGLARALYGDYRAKRCYATVGEPNCGRGLLTGALSAAFGDYVTTFDSNNLLFNPRDGADSAKQNAWLVPIANSRLCIGNEIRLTGTRFVDGNKLKTLASGGDVIKGRLNHKDESPFLCRATFLLQTNDMPAIKPADRGTLNRLCVNELKKTYKVNPDPGNPREALQDSNLKDMFESEEYKNALFHSMMDAWEEFCQMGRVYEKPACIAEATSEWVETNAGIRSLLEEGFEITKSEDDFVPMKDIIKFLREKGCADSDTKIGREMSSWGCPTDTKKVDGVAKKVRFGIKRLP